MKIPKRVINNIYRECMKLKDIKNYCGELLNLAYENNLWNNEALAIALMLSAENPKYSKNTETILELMNKFVTNSDGSYISKFTENENKFIQLVVENNLFEKYKHQGEEE